MRNVSRSARFAGAVVGMAVGALGFIHGSGMGCRFGTDGIGCGLLRTRARTV